MKGKYIRVRNTFVPDGVIVLLSDLQKHNDVPFNRDDIISAGFFSIQEVKNTSPTALFDTKMIAHCFGKSISLGVESLEEEDATMIERQFSEGGF